MTQESGHDYLQRRASEIMLKKEWLYLEKNTRGIKHRKATSGMLGKGSKYVSQKKTKSRTKTKDRRKWDIRCSPEKLGDARRENVYGSSIPHP